MQRAEEMVAVSGEVTQSDGRHIDVDYCENLRRLLSEHDPDKLVGTGRNVKKKDEERTS